MSDEPTTTAAPVYRLWVAGEEHDGTGELMPIEDPATGAVFAQCHSASAADVDAAVGRAQAAFDAGTWSRCPRQQRAEVLEAAARVLEGDLPALIALEVRQTGRAIREMQAQVPSLVRWFRYYAALLRTETRPVFPTAGPLHNWADRLPLGVVALVTPFNHPLLIAVKKLAPALAAGNCVVLKPAERTPLSALRLGRLLRDAGLPAGAFSVLPGPGPVTAAALAADPRVRSVDLTGSTAAGAALGALAGRNLARFNAELGGKAPVLVFGDADVRAAVNGIAFGAWIASGQTCVAATRILVARPVYAAVVAGLARKARFIAARMGAPSHPRCAMGPVVSARQRAHVEALLADALAGGHATAVAGVDPATGSARLTGASPLDGVALDKGYYLAPVVLVSADATTAGGGDGRGLLQTRIWREEAFGPVIVVVPFGKADTNGADADADADDDDEAEAVALANDSVFGLGATVWTRDLARAFRVSEQLRAGIVWVNTHHRNDPSSPWGPATAASGVGSENGVEALQAYTMAKSTVVNYARPAAAAAAEDWFNEDAAAVRYG